MHILEDAGEDELAEEIIRGTKIGKAHESEEDENVSYTMFSEIHEFVSAACDLYGSKKISWDKAMEELSTLCLRMKGKEKVLKKAAQVEEKDEMVR